MINHPLIELLKTFSKKDIKNFKLFLVSNYFNNRKILLVLFNLIIKYHPGYTNKKFSKEFLYEKIIKKKKYNDNTMRGLLSMLNKQALYYISIEKFVNDKFSFPNTILKELNYRGVKNPFIHYLSSCRNVFENINDVDTRFLLQKYTFEDLITNYEIMHKKVVRGKSVVKKKLERIESNMLTLFIYFFTEIISDFVNTSVDVSDFQINLKESHFKILMDIINPIILYKKFISKSQYAFIFDLYLSLFDTYSDINNDKKFNIYKNKIYLYKNKLSKVEYYIHLINLLNIITKKDSSSEKKVVLKEQFNIYRIIIENRLYEYGGTTNALPFMIYRNAILIGIKLKEYDVIENKIKDYSLLLPEDEKETGYNYGFAYLMFNQKNFERAQYFLSKISIVNFILKFDIRNLMLKILVELEKYEDAFEYIHNYRNFLGKNPFSTIERKKHTIKFLYYCEKMLNYLSGNKKIYLELLKRNILSDNDVNNKDWLLEKLNQLLIP